MREDIEDGLRIARTEVLRSWRWLTSDWRRAIVSAFLFVSLMSAGLTTSVLLYFLGRLLASGVSVPPGILDMFRVTVNFAFVYLAFLFAGRSFSEKGGVGNRDLLLTTVSPASVVVGIVVADFVRTVFVAGPLVVLLATAFGMGLGSLVVLPAVVGSFFLLVAVSLAFGYAAGFFVKLILLWLPNRPFFLKWGVRGVALALGTIAAAVFSLAFFSPPGGGNVPSGGIFSALLALNLESPLTVYADAFFVGTPLGSQSLRTVAGVVGVVASVPLLVGVSVRLAPLIWYSEDAESPSEKSTSSKRPPAVLSGTKTLRLTWRLLLRGRRNLMRFTHLIAPLLLLFGVLLISALDAPVFLALGPPVLFLAGIYLSGAAFGLNALGEEGEVLHILLTSPTSGRRFVRAQVLAGLFVSTPFVLASLAFAPFNPVVSPVYHVVLVVLGLYLSVCYSAIAVGLGFSFPRFESVHPDYDLYPPTTFASAGYLGTVFLPGVFVLVLLVLPTLRPDHFFVVQTVSFVGLGVLSAVAGAVAYTSYAHSVKQFDTYTFD